MDPHMPVKCPTSSNPSPAGSRLYALSPNVKSNEFPLNAYANMSPAFSFLGGRDSANATLDPEP